LNTPRPRQRSLGLLALGALGVVYGDIGTSPLYALRECFDSHKGLGLSETHVIAVLSMIVWSLMLVISLKYMFFILRADNRGEGGILALLALVKSKAGTVTKSFTLCFLVIGIFGAALLFGDAIITPAISVLSAVEGLKFVTPVFSPYIIPVTLGILMVLFALQRMGTGRIGNVFGPIMFVWFTTLGALGINSVIQTPEVLEALNPWYAISLFLENPHVAFLVVGGVFLSVTGGEALYADMGHFGRSSIRWSWFVLVLPGLLLNYFGQGALLLRSPEAVTNPFYLMAPEWMIFPLVVLSTIAAVIASQAVISGVFSMTRQAVQLGYLPRMRITHTSAEEIGQIYVPLMNMVLCIATVALVLSFKTSTNLAAAYGVAVSLIMVITTLLAMIVAKRIWGIHPLVVIVVGMAFLAIDSVFLFSNLMKIHDGGWVSLIIATFASICMLTWKKGRMILMDRLSQVRVPLKDFVQNVEKSKITRVPGTAVFMTADPEGTPIGLTHNLLHNHVLHETVIVMNVTSETRPYVLNEDRLEIKEVGKRFFHVVAHYGFMQTPNIPRIIEMCRFHGVDIHWEEITFFFGRETLIATDRVGMAKWRENLFIFMSRNAQTAMEFFRIPPNKVIELGIQVEL